MHLPCNNAVRGFIPLLIILCASAVPPTQAFNKPKFCGSALNEILDLVCDNGFRKKVVNDDEDTHDHKKQAGNVQVPLKKCTLKAILIGKPCASGAATSDAEQAETPRRKRRSDGIVDECCRNGCNYADILDYCV